MKPIPHRPLRGVLALLLCLPLLAWAVACAPPPSGESETAAEGPQFPATVVAVVDGRFEGAEGLTFNGEGDLYVTADKALWRLAPDWQATRIADLQSNVGLAPIGARDVLVADFGPTWALDVPGNTDGLVLRVTPEGEVTTVATGIGDPNAIVVRPDGSLLVSDDFTDKIYRVGPDGAVDVFTDLVDFPNGIALAPDGSALYVAQIFTRLKPIQFDDRLWRLPLKNGRPAGDVEVLFASRGHGGNDGLTMDAEGRIYVAANREGKIWRVDPADGSAVVVAENMTFVGSLAFGQGEFDHRSIYATQVKGGKIWRVEVGVEGAPLER